MNKILIGSGVAVVTLAIFYFDDKTRQDEAPTALTYALGLSACLFISILVYKLLQDFKKK
jgi:hypothetical protein